MHTFFALFTLGVHATYIHEAIATSHGRPCWAMVDARRNVYVCVCVCLCPVRITGRELWEGARALSDVEAAAHAEKAAKLK